MAAAREAAARLNKAMPADYPEWGVMRTRAYMQLLEIITAKKDNKTMKAAVLEGYLEALGRASTWSLDYCQHLSALHARAVDIGMSAA